LIITDASNRATEDYSIALKWKEKTTSQADAASDVTYEILRSVDGTTFDIVANITSTGYLDVNLSNKTTYYYQVKSKDSAGSISAPSTMVSKMPEGRYTTPPEITSGPTIVTDSFSAIVTWKTERATTSFVEFDNNETRLSQEQGESDLILDHSITVTGLHASTDYWYQVKSVDVDGNIKLSPLAKFTTLEAPFVSNVAITDIKLYDAYITWVTNKATTTSLEYGSSTNYGSVQADTSGSRTTTHSVRLERLTDDTTYHFKPTGLDSTGNIPESGDYTFTTLTFPKITDASAKNKSAGQTEVTWKTNVPTTSSVEYYGDVIPPKTQGNTALVTDHSILLYGLEDATRYKFKVRGSDQFGYEAISAENEFTTLEDTTPPEIFGVNSESNTIGSGEDSKIQIIVNWKTNEPTTSQVDFGVGMSGSEYTDQTEEAAELVMEHLVVIGDLSPAKTYHFRGISKDKAGNETKSGSYSVLTTRKRESFLQVIIGNLEETFSWVGNMGKLF
jgi:hypothetical protein